MQAQHKGMLKDLIGGKFDSKIVERSKNAATLNGPAPLNVDAGAQHRASFGLAVDGGTPTKGKTPAVSPSKPPAPSAGVYAKAVESGATGRSETPFAKSPNPPPAPGKPPPGSTAKPPGPSAPPARPVVQPAAATGAPPTFGGLPPKSSAQPTVGTPAAVTRPVPPPAAIAPAPKNESAIVLEAETLARAFESKDESAVDSIFGEDLISEKSLDEVILSYLADDLQKG
jgi:hypothetical protein